METVEQKCREMHTGVVPRSPIYKRIHMKLDYWRMRYKQKLGIHRNVRHLIVLQNKLNIKYDMTLTTKQAIIRIR